MGTLAVSHLIAKVVFWSVILNGPASNFGTAVNSPFSVVGTLHVCWHTPPQPN